MLLSLLHGHDPSIKIFGINVAPERGNLHDTLFISPFFLPECDVEETVSLQVAGEDLLKIFPNTVDFNPFVSSGARPLRLTVHVGGSGPV